MKRLFSLAMAAAVAFGLASCSKDVNYGNGGAEDGALVATFSIQTPKGAFVTYADIAEGAEWTVNNIDVYAFQGEDMIGGKKLTKDTDYEVTSADGAAVTTIKVKSSWLAPLAGKEVQFYFVGNDIAGTTGAIKAVHVDPTKITKTAFEAQVTKALDATGGKMSEVIRTPLLFSAKSEVIKLVGRIQAKATLTRREARFDILNKYAAETVPNNLVVTAIKISNAPRSGKIFADGGADVIAWAGIDHTKIDVPVYPANYTAEQDAKYPTNPLEKTYRAKSVFYLYPTIIGEDAAHTEISIEATMGGNSYTFTRAKEDAKGNAIAPKEITANYRYTLVLDPLSLTFDIEKADYTDGSEIETETGGDSSISLGTVAGTAAANYSGGTYTIGATGGTLEFTATTKYGTAFEVVDVKGNAAALGFDDTKVTKTSSVTYAGYTTVDTYTVTVPSTPDTDTENYYIRLNIFSPNGTGKETILFQRGSVSTEDIVEIVSGNKELATVIEEAIKSLPSYTEGDAITPEDIEKIESINVGGDDGPNSLDGIENLPNLTELQAGINPNLTGQIDLTGNPKLETVYLSGNPNITGVDLSGCPELVTLNLSGPNENIVKLDLSANTKLQYAYLGGLLGLKSLDISKNPVLKELVISGIPITNIDFKSNSLEYLQLGTLSYDFKYTSVDLSGMPNLKKYIIRGTDIEALTPSTMGMSHPNVKEFRIYGYDSMGQFPEYTTATKSIDMSGFPALEEFQAQRMPKLESVDVSKCSNIKNFDVRTNKDIACNAFSTVNLSGLSNLNTVRFDYMGLKNVVLSNMASLSSVVFQYTGLETITITDAPALLQINLRGTRVSNLDIRNLKTLNYLNLLDIENITVNTWYGFNTTNPKASLQNGTYGAPKNIAWTGHNVE